MRNDTLQEAEFLARNRRRIWQKAVSVLACGVVFCTTYALILPAITMEKAPQCGKTAHTHTEDCYIRPAGESTTVPVCTLESLNLHRHTDACLNENGGYSCGYADFVVHQHDTSCYDENGNLWCPLPEIRTHTHTEDCYGEPEAGPPPESAKPVHIHTSECYIIERGELTCTRSTEPHTHTEECYTQAKTLVCPIPESDDHHHSLECYETASELTCTLSEEPHQHTDECYAQEKVLTCEIPTGEETPAPEEAQRPLICGKAEIILHEHNSSCFDESGALICGQAQVLEHVHGQSCFQTEEGAADTETLTCTIPEGAGAHSHSIEAGCYDGTGALICQLEESVGHRHGPLCYGKWVLTCTLEEHTHTEECFVDLTADLENPGIWESSLPGYIPENWEDAVAEVARSQLGYRESERNYIVDEQGEKKGYTRYGQWYGDPYGDWDAMFVSFCLHYAGVPADAFPQDASSGRWAERLQQENCGLYLWKEGYAPKAGDLVFFDTDWDSAADHVGIVTELLTADNGTVQIRAVEGDAYDGVRAAAYGLDDLRILGYGVLPGREPTVLTWSQNGLTITATFPAEAALPANAQLAVEPLFLDGGMAPMLLSETDGGPVSSSADLFRICVKADGEEIAPQTQANVEFRLQGGQQPAEDGTELLQYSEDGAEPVNLTADGSGDLTGSFDADLSEVYALTSPMAYTAAPPARAQDVPADVPITPHKTIDAFRDGADNPDTTLDNQTIDQTDLYRLYLDAQLGGFQTPVDLLIVVDQSGSMHKNYANEYDSSGNIPIYPDDDPNCVRDMTDDAGNAIFRDQAVQLVLNGTYNASDYSQKMKNGLIYQFLAANEENNVAVVGFQGDSAHNEYGTSWKYDRDGDHNTDANTILRWTKTPQYVNVEGKKANATNYCAGFLEADRRLDDSEIANNGHKKVILFLSDGLPTCHIAHHEPNIFNRKDFYYREGNGQDEGKGTKEATDSYFNDLRTHHPDVTIHTVSILAATAEDRLQTMATQGGGNCYSVSTTDDLRKNLKSLMYGTIYSDLVIEDTLSEYVDLYDGQPDFKVTVRDADGTETVLYEDTAGGITAAGAGVIESVTYDTATRKVTAAFVPAYTPKPGSTVTVSFNVKTSQTAYDTYAKTGYPAAGDPATDYGYTANGIPVQNNTSSVQPGFYSNTGAKLSDMKDNVPGSAEYPHPVVQTAVCKVVIQKTDSTAPDKTLSGAQFHLYRRARAGEQGTTLESLEGTYIRLYDQPITTDENGQAVLQNLVPGDYCLVETKAPEGYRKPSAPVPFTLTRSTDGNGQIEGSSETITLDEETLPVLVVTNTPWGHELPEAGGTGTTPYTTGGLLTICACCLLLYHNKKRRKEDSASS